MRNPTTICIGTVDATDSIDTIDTADTADPILVLSFADASMTLNQELTALLAGETVDRVEELDTLVTIKLRCGAVLRVHAESEMAINVPSGAALTQVHEEGSDFEVSFDRGERLVLHLVNPGASISFRDADGNVTYLG